MRLVIVVFDASHDLVLSGLVVPLSVELIIVDLFESLICLTLRIETKRPLGSNGLRQRILISASVSQLKVLFFVVSRALKM